MRRIAVTGLRAAVGTLALAACSADSLQVPNYNNATPDQILSDPAAIPMLATGVLRDDRGNHPGWVLGTGILGREAYNYTSTEGRNTSGWLVDVNSQAGFVNGSYWAAYYTTLRDIAKFVQVVEAAPATVLDASQKSAALGFAHTMEALQLSYIIASRHNLGAPVDVQADPTGLAPFVSRDSVYALIVAKLNQGATELAAGGSAFPFTFHAGYAGFNTPANYRKFNRALAARVNAWRGSLGIAACGAGGATCYQAALAALNESFIDPAGSLTTGPQNVFSQAAGDAANTNGNSNNTSVVAHYQSDQGVQAGDKRWADKIIKLAAPKAASNATIGVTTTFDFSNNVYSGPTSPISIIRNEELILLRAEARWFTGDQAGALADINTIRTRSGALAPLTSIADKDAFVTELLYNRRWSLLFEGHRWIDMRRFGKLNELPKDLANHIVGVQLPVPQAECLQRASAPAELKGPGCT